MSEQYSARFFWSGVITIIMGLIVLFSETVVSGTIVVVTSLILLLGGGAQVALGFIEENSGNKLAVHRDWCSDSSFWDGPFCLIRSLGLFHLRPSYPFCWR
ncbi:hypothetical protein G8770_11610 [Aestuariicella hydrocarbonica]|uniref:Uncharacterized protein n=1 Tax=Pseudomaricurvus hydrocarbonicus TaxID=1470433 RepID=A0A9E5JX49_9GAMM|nr:hypothetical protein [Aestuariicella hydrocarbonica]NHO66191.1 hypothetical protein [Aestuariicella hydrocarbonica]